MSVMAGGPMGLEKAGPVAEATRCRVESQLRLRSAGVNSGIDGPSSERFYDDQNHNQYGSDSGYFVQ